MSDDLEFIVIDDIPEYIFYIGDDEENEQVIAISGKDGAFKYEKVAELPTTGEDGVLYLVPKSHTTQTASGNPISVNITDNAGKIESLKLDGNTTQQTYSGAQMLKKQGMATPSSDTNYWASFTNLTQTPESNGWAKLEKTATNNYANFNTSTSSANITGGQTYTAIVEVKNSTFASGQMVFAQTGQTQDPVSSYTIVQGCDFTNESSMGIYLASVSSPNVYTFVAKSSFTRGLRYYIQTGTTGSVEVRATLLAGDHSSDWQNYCGDNWQPYVGETASPSPDYPQAVNTVTGTQTIKVVGKNLFDKANAVVLNAYISAGANITTSPTNDRCIYIPCEPSTTYTVQKMEQATTNRNRFRLGTTTTVPQIGDKVSNYWNAGDGSTTTTHTITTGSEARYLVAYIYCKDTLTSLDDVLASLQIEKGSTATAYAPYYAQTLPVNLGSIELCKIDTYQDYIYKDGEDWKIHKTTSKWDIDTTPDWNMPNTSSYPHLYQAVINLNIASGYTAYNYGPGLYCTHLLKKLSNGDGDENVRTTQGIALYNSGGSVYCRLNQASLTTLPEFTTWVTENSISVYYALATATDTTITDQTLIAQLEAVRTAALSTGSNTISNTATGTNLAGDLEIGYYGYDPLNKYDKYFWLDIDGGYESL